jgi:hypothetical protein
MRHCYFILTCLICTFFSCSSLKHAVQYENRLSLSKTNLNMLNGKFNAYPTSGDSSKADLYWDLFDVGYNPKHKPNFIEINNIGPNKLSIAYWDGDHLIKSKLFQGKIKDGYFVFKRRYLIIPAILANLYRNRKFRIGLLPNGNLMTDYDQISFATFYIILPSLEHKKYYGVEFERLK